MDGSTLQGRVESIARGITDQDNKDGPELLANVNPTFTWVRLAQRIPVRVRITDVPSDVLISAGMTCTVVLKEGADCSCALFTVAGETMAQSIALPQHLGVLAATVKSILRDFPIATMAEGDVYIMNDPYDGGTHIPDITMVTPVLWRGRYVAVAACMAHQSDMGGMAIGSIVWGQVATRTGIPAALTTAIQHEFLAVDDQLPVSRFRTMEQVISESTARANFNMLLLTIFAGTALLLAALGIYGLMSYSVEQRTQEIGIRVALGASGNDILRMVLRRGLLLAGIGLAVGLAAAFGLTRLLSSLLFGVKASDPIAFCAVVVTLAAVAWVAIYIPARRATRIDPLMALRYE